MHRPDSTVLRCRSAFGVLSKQSRSLPWCRGITPLLNWPTCPQGCFVPWIESGGCLICVKMDAEFGETLRELGVFGGRRCAYDTENGFVLRSQKKNHIFCVCVWGGPPIPSFLLGFCGPMARWAFWLMIFTEGVDEHFPELSASWKVKSGKSCKFNWGDDCRSPWLVDWL